MPLMDLIELLKYISGISLEGTVSEDLQEEINQLNKRLESLHQAMSVCPKEKNREFLPPMISLQKDYLSFCQKHKTILEEELQTADESRHEKIRKKISEIGEAENHHKTYKNQFENLLKDFQELDSFLPPAIDQ